MLTVLTTSTKRPRQFALLEGYVARQTRKPDRWLVVGEDLTGYRFNQGQEAICRATKDDPKDLHSICLNSLEGIQHIRASKVVVLDDDDWIRPDYLQVMDEALDKANLAGSAPAYYWHVQSKRWRSMKNQAHCSLGQTGFNPPVYEAFKTACKIKNNPFIDMVLWVHWPQTLQGSSLILANDDRKPLHVGIKGLTWGIPGAGLGHDPMPGIKDLSLIKLRRWIGNDVWNYYGRDGRPLK